MKNSSCAWHIGIGNLLRVRCDEARFRFDEDTTSLMKRLIEMPAIFDAIHFTGFFSLQFDFNFSIATNFQWRKRSFIRKTAHLISITAYFYSKVESQRFFTLQPLLLFLAAVFACYFLLFYTYNIIYHFVSPPPQVLFHPFLSDVWYAIYTYVI